MRRIFRRKDRYASRQDVDHLKFLLDRLGEIVKDETGQSLASAASVQVSVGVPPGLVAASRCRYTGGEPVQLDIKGVPLIAVVSGEGDPRAWFAALATLTHPSYAARPGVPRIGHRPFPEGLLVAARRDGGTALWVAEGIGAGEQRTAVLAALKAARRQGWRTPVLVPAVVFGAGMAWDAARAHAALAAKVGTAAAVAAGVGVAMAYLPVYTTPAHAARPGTAASRIAHRRKSTGEGRNPPSRHSPAPGHATHRRSGGVALAGRGVTPHTPGQPSPALSSPPSSPPSPKPSPIVTVGINPSPSPSHPLVKTCVWVPLVGRVCIKA